VTAVVFYDENGNGRLDAGEQGRLPGVVVDAGGRRANTEVLSGRARVSGVLAGQTTVTVRPESLPLFWVAGAGVPVTVPTDLEIELPVTLPIGDNAANVYLAFGDSITDGEGSSSDQGYIELLEDRLRATFAVGEVRKDAASGTTSLVGAARLGARLNRNRPAYTLILYGTNDWNFCDDVASCYTLDSLASMVAQVKGRQGLPALATIPPVNVGYDARAPAARNEWVAETNVGVRALAQAEGALLVDVEKALLAEANGNFASLFVDHVHPNDRGYEIIADTFYRALSAARAQAVTTGARTNAPGPSFGPSLEAPPLAPGWRSAPDRTGPPERLELSPLDLPPLRATRGVRPLTRGRDER
jgi:lysophospholipase L1-like esterase